MRSVMITGGSRGIGAAMVRAFSRAGYRVAFTYKNSHEQAVALASECGALAIRADSESPSDIASAVERVASEYGSVDVLINNAAFWSQGLLQDITLDEWNKVLSVSLTGAFLYSKMVIPEMLEKKWGRIINISSMWGIAGASCEVHYSAAKAGIIGFTKALAQELGPSGITVNAIAPGVVATDMNANFDEACLAELCEQTPVGRIASVEEIARCALFLADEKSGFITAEVMNVSGGFIT